jgi:hypothetical protein
MVSTTLRPGGAGGRSHVPGIRSRTNLAIRILLFETDRRAIEPLAGQVSYPSFVQLWQLGNPRVTNELVHFL